MAAPTPTSAPPTDPSDSSSVGAERGSGPNEDKGQQGGAERGFDSKSDVKGAGTLADPLSALGSIWSGWMSPKASTAGVTGSASTAGAGATATTTTTGTTGNTSNGEVSSAAAVANEWLAGAGKMWESAVKDVGCKLKYATEGVDTAALGEQVAVIRQKSGRLMEDMSKSMQNMNVSLDQEELHKQAEVISNSTREFLGKATQKLEQSRAEALEIFVDRGAGAGTGDGERGVAPWDVRALKEEEREYADGVRREMLKIVVDCIYSKKKREEMFLSEVVGQEEGEFGFEKKAGMAMAALEADGNMRRLRAGLVPGKMKEEAFWRRYFYHVDRVRQSLVANGGVMAEVESGDVEEEDAATMFGEADVGGGEGGGQEREGRRNWDDEIDAIFDEGEE